MYNKGLRVCKNSLPHRKLRSQTGVPNLAKAGDREHLGHLEISRNTMSCPYFKSSLRVLQIPFSNIPPPKKKSKLKKQIKRTIYAHTRICHWGGFFKYKSTGASGCFLLIKPIANKGLHRAKKQVSRVMPREGPQELQDSGKSPPVPCEAGKRKGGTGSGL